MFIVLNELNHVFDRSHTLISLSLLSNVSANALCNGVKDGDPLTIDPALRANKILSWMVMGNQVERIYDSAEAKGEKEKKGDAVSIVDVTSLAKRLSHPQPHEPNPDK